MRRLVYMSTLMLAGCDAPESTTPESEPTPAPTRVAEPTPVAEPKQPEPAPPLVRAPGGAGPAERREAVLDVLMGGRAGELEVVAADPEDRFDPALAELMTPTVRVTIPGIRMRAATVAGPLDKDIVRRIVRAHVNEVRYCYNQGLLRDPRSAGLVVVDFEVSLTGKVDAARLASSAVTDEEVGPCIVAAVQRWTFPKPEGATVQVSLPFELEPPRPLTKSDPLDREDDG